MARTKKKLVKFPSCTFRFLPHSRSCVDKATWEIITVFSNFTSDPCKPVRLERWSSAAGDKPPKTVKFMSHIQPVRCLSSLFVFGERKSKVHLNSQDSCLLVNSSTQWAQIAIGAGLQAPVLLSMQSSIWRPYLRHLTKYYTQSLLSRVCIFKKYIHLESNNTSMQ